MNKESDYDILDPSVILDLNKEIIEIEDNKEVTEKKESINEIINKENSTLPEGWTIITKIRKRGITKGRVDKYWYSPTGVKYNSMVQVKKALNKNK